MQNLFNSIQKQQVAKHFVENVKASVYTASIVKQNTKYVFSPKRASIVNKYAKHVATQCNLYMLDAQEYNMQLFLN